MKLGRVVGTVVATVKAPGLTSYKILVVAPFDAGAGSSADSVDGSFVAIDLAGAGDGDVVLTCAGSAARVMAGAESAPTDAAVVAVVDTVQLGPRTAYQKT